MEIHEANQERVDLLEYVLSFDNRTAPRSDEVKNKKNDIFDSAKNVFEGRELVVNAFKSGLFPLKSTIGTRLKILTSKQMLQNLVNEIRQIVHFLYQSKEITKKCIIT